MTTTYTVKYRYTINDRAYEAVTHTTKPLKKGSALKSCYDPAKPEFEFDLSK